MEQEEKCGFTGRPEINRKSQSINRSINDLYAWENSRRQKLESQRMMAEEEELAEVWAHNGEIGTDHQ